MSKTGRIQTTARSASDWQWQGTGNKLKSAAQTTVFDTKS